MTAAYVWISRLFVRVVPQNNEKRRRRERPQSKTEGKGGLAPVKDGSAARRSRDRRAFLGIFQTAPRVCVRFLSSGRRRRNTAPADADGITVTHEVCSHKRTRLFPAVSLFC